MVYELGFRRYAVFLKRRKNLEQMVLKKFTTFMVVERQFVLSCLKPGAHDAIIVGRFQSVYMPK